MFYCFDLVATDDFLSLGLVVICHVSAPVIYHFKMCFSANVFNEVSANLRKRSGKYSFVQFKAALPPSEVNSWVVMLKKLLTHIHCNEYELDLSARPIHLSVLWWYLHL